ncbi:MAG3960 family lipoprotein [Mycoplasmopsis bovis]|uniref:MAG3960 family lipoprotein n=1 Tax=Mycoplasmopsis bovis TaxID=28903 RepID=UPI001BDF4842|nr:hypothetical protein [Mycoplasmopsis bovis]MBT1337519.1 hypothetical protein [Mycoplasmopsis bovis]MBT1338711.1 hypothetical protein [Mycoplasmopsis bovis]UJB27537.1 hypothetical protein FG867_01985 [Mycoplasmopsis bovis]
MKKRMIIGGLGLVALMPLVTVSCKFFGLNVSEIITGGPSHTTPPRKDPDHKDSFNENEQEIVPTKFTYNGKTYTINREDILDTKNAVYANLVLNNNAEGFKKLIPSVEEYRKVKNLYADDTGFPSIAEVSYYVRNLEHLKNGFIYREKSNSPERISKDEYISLVDKVSEIMANSNLEKALTGVDKEYVDFDNVRNYTLAKLEEFHGKAGKYEWGELTTKKVSDLAPGSFKMEEYYKEIPPENNYDGLRTNESKKRPSKLWVYNRMINNTDFYNYNKTNKPNELFIHNEFLYGRKLDPKKYYLEIDVLMLIIWLKAKRYTMQYPLWKMLTTYLELQKALIKKQEWDKEKSLTDNFKKLKLIEKLDSFHDAVLDYMKLGQLVGFTDDRSNDLYLFPTDVNKEVKTDFRDAYRWAYYEYHLFIQPMYVALSRGTKEAFEKAFEKEELKPYYDFIWENIKLADKVDKPRILSKNEALEKAKEIIKHYQNNFGWEFKSDESREDEDE